MLIMAAIIYLASSLFSPSMILLHFSYNKETSTFALHAC